MKRLVPVERDRILIELSGGHSHGVPTFLAAVLTDSGGVYAYRDWVAQQEALELAERLDEDAAEFKVDGRPPLTDTLSLWVTARYAAATRQVSQTEGAKGWRALREPCADVVELRRGDHRAERLRIEREHLAATRYRQQEERARELWAWSQQPKIREFLQRDDHDHTATLQALGKLMFGEPFMEWAQGVPESDAGQRGAEDAAGPAAVPASSPGADSNQGESSLGIGAAW